MGMLSSTEVIEASASDLVAQYVGQTGPKTKKLFERGLGKVLFVDEAYRLGTRDRFAQEAIDEMVSLLTQDTFAGKIVVVLAGYTDDMNNLLSANAGLSSRFPEEIMFDHIAPAKCVSILLKELEKQQIAAPHLEDPDAQEVEQLVDVFKQLGRLPGWGNARDVITLSKEIMRAAVNSSANSTATTVQLEPNVALTLARKMLKDKRERLPKSSGQAKYGWLDNDDPPAAEASSSPPPPPSIATNTNSSQNPGAPPPAAPAPPAASSPPPTQQPPAQSPPASIEPQHGGRDAGVSDAVWNQLERDKDAEIKEAEQRAKDATTLAAARERAEAERRRLEQEERQAADAAARRELEAKRIRAIQVQERLRKLEEERQRVERERKKREEEVQLKLRQLGVCVAGYQWIKQGGGYRCAGGSHFVTDGQLGI